MKKLLTRAALAMLPFLLCAYSLLAQVQPQVYYTFDNTNPLAPTIGTTNLTAQGTYTIRTGGPVGKYVNQNNTTSKTMTGQSVPSAGTIYVEMLFNADYQFSNNRDPVLFTIGNMSAKFIYPEIRFTTSTNVGGTNVSDNFIITLNGIGPKSWAFWVKDWHHVVFAFSAQAGFKAIYVDGALPVGFSKSLTTGTASPATNNNLILNTATSYSMSAQNMDEIAVYTQTVTPAQIASDYEDYRNGLHYRFLTSATVPSPTVTQAPLNVNEFPYGYVLGSTNSNGVTNSATSQLKNYMLPRYSPAATAPPNFDWMALNYMAGEFQPGISRAMMAETASVMNIELARNWNYYFLLNTNANSANYTDTTRFEGKQVATSNRNKQFKTSIITFWSQLNPTVAGCASNRNYIQSQNLPANHYVRNASGQFLATNGTVTTGTKFYSPAASLDSIKNDAKTVKNRMQLLANAMTDTLDIVNENDEVLTLLDSPMVRLDPAVLSAMSGLGFGNARQYIGYAWYTFSKLLQDSVRSIPAFDTTGFTQYQIDGQDGTNGRNYFRANFMERRKINTDPTFGNCSTFDFYPRYPYNWRYNQSAFRGWQPLVEARNTELGLGDSYFTPFVAAGYNANEEINIRPAQYMGLMKCLNLFGARSFYTGYFNEAASYNPPNPPPANPKGYVWQAIVPVYAQAATDWVMSNTGTDTLLAGDMPDDYVKRTGSFFGFYSGTAEILTLVRKKITLPDTIEYNIGTCYQRMSSQIGASPLVDTAVFTVEGRNMRLLTRLQGSVYKVDLNKDTAVVIQYDAWHENTHPERWSKDFYIEAEHYGEYVSGAKDVRSIPYQASAASSFDFTASTTYLTWRDSANYSRDTLSYAFNLRTDTTLYVWVKMRSIDVTKTAGFSCRVDNGAAHTQNLVVDTAFLWYRVALANDTIKYAGLTAGLHTFKLFPTSARTEIDQFLLTPNALTALPEGVPGTTNPCSTAVVPTITPSGPITQCGGNVVLQSSAAASYLWSSGETTQSITVSNTGGYVVTVTNGSGCTGVSASTSVTINKVVQATISPAGPVTQCGGQATLTAASVVSGTYLWSNSATTQSISVTSGTYTVTLTNSNGCTSVSSPVTVSILTPPTAGISPSGTISVCSGTPVTITATGGASYLWSTSETTASISPTVSGNYTVIVTDIAGCSAQTIPSKTVTFNALPSAIVLPSSVSACTGTTVPLTVSGAGNYVWNTGQVSQTINITTSGSYVVTVTSTSGCSSVSTPVVATFAPCNCVSTDSIYTIYIGRYNAKIAWKRVTSATNYIVTATDLTTSGSSKQTWNSSTTILLLNKLKPNREYKIEIMTLCGANYSSAKVFYLKTLPR